MDVTGIDELAASLDNSADALAPALQATMAAAMDDLAGYVRDSELSGQALNVRSGRLRDSVRADVTGDDNGVSGSVSANTAYAAIHEYGGVIELTPRFQVARRLRKPAAGQIVEPERSYLRQGLADKADRIRAALTVAVMEVLP